MNAPKQKAIVAAVLLGVSGVAAGYGCPPVIDPIWQAAMTAAGTAIDTAVTAAGESITESRSLNMQRIQSALRVLTKQESVSATKQADMEIKAREASANFATEIAARKATFETMLEYNGKTGQGFDPCGEQARSQTVATAIGEASAAMQTKVLREVDASPGRFSASPAQVVAARAQSARGKYCSSAEASFGYCESAGALAGKDVSAGNFYETKDVGSGESDAKSALLNHIYGVPYPVPNKVVAAGPSGRAFLAAKQSEDAYRSVSQNSLKTIQSLTEKNGSEPSVLDALAEKVSTYVGGTLYQEWEKNKMYQSEHGLLVEYAKMKAFELYMRNLEYQTLERQETNIAAILAMRARQMPKTADRAVGAAEAASKVK